MASRSALADALNLLWPPTCPICNNPTSAARKLCTDCWADLRILTEPLCEYCGGEVKGHQAMICEDCYEVNRPWQAGRCCASYQGTARKMVLRLKHMRSEDLAQIMAEIAQQHCQSFFREADFIIPVPLHWRKNLKRGFNQAALIAHHLSKLNHIPMREDILKRAQYTKAQTRQSNFEARFENLNHAFALKNPDAIKGKHILLVDDVFTSGASFQNCCEALVRGKPATLSVFAFARAGENLDKT